MSEPEGPGWRPSGFPSISGPPVPPRRSVAPFVAGLVIGGAVIGVVAWFFLTGPAGQGAPSPSATPIAVVTPGGTPIASIQPSSPSGSGGPAGSAPGSGGPPGGIDPAIEAQIREVTSQVPPIRGLEPLREVPFRFLDRDEAAAALEAEFNRLNPPERVAAEDDVLTRLGLLSPEDDLEDLVLSLNESQVAAFYDPSSGQFTIITDESFRFGPAERLFAAHEYTHALQDQHYDLAGTRVMDPSEGDRALAEQSLTEGDATALMFEWAIQHLDAAEFTELLTEPISGADDEILAGMPLVLRRLLLSPYLDGYSFVAALQAHGGWEAVDAAWSDRPASTEHILHPDKYLAGEQPLPIEGRDVAAALGQGWAASSTQTMGELLISVWVADGVELPGVVPGIPAGLANAEAAAGWAADRLVSVDGPDGSWAVEWLTEWDTWTDSDEFAASAEAAMADLPFPNEVSHQTFPDEVIGYVTVSIASDQPTLDSLRATRR